MINTLMEDIVLVGFGGHAKSIVDTIEQIGEYRIIGFTEKAGVIKECYRGYEVIGEDGNLENIYRNGVKIAFICVGFLGKGNLRNLLYSKLKAIGFELPSIIDKTAICALDAKIEEGVYIGKGVCINSGAVVGKMSIINTRAVIEHDVTVGEFVHVAPGSVVCGGGILEIIHL